MIYVDTSLIVTAITGEASTTVSQQWLREQEQGQLCVSWWHRTEVASALAQKKRAGDLSLAQHNHALEQWWALADQWQMLPIDPAHFSLAADLTLHGVRSADALHLAVAFAARAALATRDKALAAVTGKLGMSVHQLA